MKNEVLEDPIHYSDTFHKFSLPNLWLDTCTHLEKEKLEALITNDYSEFDKIAKRYAPLASL